MRVGTLTTMLLATVMKAVPIYHRRCLRGWLQDPTDATPPARCIAAANLAHEPTVALCAHPWTRH
jgi:hypothetical protein